ncbi:MAG: hypothetical protein HOV79_11055 [Hamadaea sp.]|nr:hypothetical protein [Hamadaea sp.]
MTYQQLRTSAMDTWRRTSVAGGITSIILGLVLLIWPGQTLLVFACLLAIGLILLGISRIASGIVGRGDAEADGPVMPAHRADGRARLWRVLTGVVYLVAGIVILANLPGSVRTLVVIVGILWIVSGIAEVVAGFAHPAGDRAVNVVIGLMNVAFGVVLLVWPDASLVFLVWIAGIWLILTGALQLIFAFMIRRATK